MHFNQSQKSFNRSRDKNSADTAATVTSNLHKNLIIKNLNSLYKKNMDSFTNIYLNRIVP